MKEDLQLDLNFQVRSEAYYIHIGVVGGLPTYVGDMRA